MRLIKILKPDFTFEDERGFLAQITHSSFSQVNAIFTKKGAVRGNYHYHRFSDEVFFVISGKVKVSAYLDDVTDEHIFQRGEMFLIPENVRHCFEYHEDTYLVAFYTSRIELEDGEKDIVCD